MDGNKYTHDVFISFSFKDQTIVESIVNQLLNRYGIKYWICTRDIRAGQHYDDKIYEAIKSSKVFVLIQSQSSVESDEVPKEIRLAIKFKKTIIPFVIEDSEWIGGIAYQLINTQEINATLPTLEERIAELAEEIRNIIGDDNRENKDSNSVSHNEQLLSTPNVIPKTVFCGREDILEEIYEKFKDSERVLFLHGIGGIGKTQIVKQYAKQHKNDYETIIYATYNGSLKEMVVAELPFAIEPALIRYTLSNGTQEDDNAFFVRKLEFIQRVANEKTLIIIDNFDVDNDESLPMLMNGKYHLLITTRCDYSRFYPTIRINPIDSMDALIDIFMRNYQGDDVEKDDPTLIELIELVNRHTYTIELLAQHMENSGQTPAEMIMALKERGITSLDEEVRNSDMKTQIAYENLLKMFKIFSLSEEERQILMYLSLMPIEGVDVKDFKKWADLKSPRVIKNLESRSWIIRNTDGIAMHPIIKEVVKHEISIRLTDISGFLLRFSETINEHKSWHFTKEEKDKYASIALSMRKSVDEVNESTFEFYYSTQRLLSYAINPELSLEIAKKIYEFSLKNFEGYNFYMAKSTYIIGWTYAFNKHLPDAINKACLWLEKSNEIYSSLKIESIEEKKAYNSMLRDLAKSYYQLYLITSDCDIIAKAKKYYQQAIDYATKMLAYDEQFYSILAGAYRGLSRILSKENNFEDALNLNDKSYQILLERFGEDDVDTAHAISSKALLLYSLNEYSRAYELGVKALSGYNVSHGGDSTWVCEMKEFLGDCMYQLQNYDSASEYYKEALLLAEKLYIPGAKQILDLKTKVS